MLSTLQALAERATRAGAEPGVRDATLHLSCAELHATVCKLALDLRAAEVTVVALAADNSPHWVAVDLAAQLAGVVLVPLPGFFTAEQMAHALQDSGADGLVTTSLGAERLSAALGVRVRGAVLTGELELFRLADAVPAELPHATAKISYTSGTTGRPKGVCLTRHVTDAVAQSLTSVVAELELRRHLCTLPLAVLLENVAGVYAPLQSGAEIVVPSLAEVGMRGATEFDVRRWLACVAAYEAESVILLPQMLAALVAALESGAPRPRSLRFIAVGGARVAGPLLARADRLGLPVYEGYGLTECGSVVALNSPRARRAGSVGRPLPHVRVEIGAAGEVLVGGAAVAGYVGGSAVPERIATGDLGHLDAEGFLHISGRRKNVFITSFGRNVSPEWVETELAAEPEIAQVAVFGEARPWNVAVIVPRAASGRAGEIQAAVERANQRLPDYARAHEWLLADALFTPQNGLLTANGRNRRAAIWAHYGPRVDAVYDRAIERIA